MTGEMLQCRSCTAITGIFGPTSLRTRDRTSPSASSMPSAANAPCRLSKTPSTGSAFRNRSSKSSMTLSRLSRVTGGLVFASIHKSGTISCPVSRTPRTNPSTIVLASPSERSSSPNFIVRATETSVVASAVRGGAANPQVSCSIPPTAIRIVNDLSLSSGMELGLSSNDLFTAQPQAPAYRTLTSDF